MLLERCGARLSAMALVLGLSAGSALAQDTIGIVVYQSDFGLKDGAVSEMKGVAVGVDPTLRLEDLTHEIPAFNIWEGAYRLSQTVPYWPAGTVFVSVVDPGVGTDRKSVVARLGSGHYVVTPDNGTLTMVADQLGLVEVREIDEETNRLPGSESSHTFHGRDVYSYTAARLASGTITFEEVGPSLGTAHEAIPYSQASYADGAVVGNIPILDVQYGNVWTNVDAATFDQLGAALGDVLNVTITNDGAEVYQGAIPYVTTFGDVPEGDPLIYFNSLGNLSFALNYDDFAGTYGIESGPGWSVTVTK